jgi:hypothetical protein
MELIQSWMANGLLQKSNKSTRDLEDIGQQYLNELLSRSFFQEIEQHSHSGSHLKYMTCYTIFHYMWHKMIIIA